MMNILFQENIPCTKFTNWKLFEESCCRYHYNKQQCRPEHMMNILFQENIPCTKFTNWKLFEESCCRYHYNKQHDHSKD
jgi:hypothetical protein